MKKIVVGSPGGLPFPLPGVPVVSAREYLASPEWLAEPVHVVNLSAEYRYGSRGYYVSLLAEARGHRVMPSVKTIQDLKTSSLTRILSDELGDLIGRSLRRLRGDDFILSVYFGRNLARQHDRLARELFRVFQAPFLRARFARRSSEWQLQSVRALSMSEVPEDHLDFVGGVTREYFARRSYQVRRRTRFVRDLAILHDPGEPTPPSDRRALAKFVAAGERQGFRVELITRDDYARIGEFDALFIRETTRVHHHTYRFARRAESEGVAVIDDPTSILRCTNKVYLAELLAANGIPTPKTLIVHHDNVDPAVAELGLPLVLKIPDGSFSTGVRKAASTDEARAVLTEMLGTSDLVVAQAYVPTDFDWRIGVLDGEPLFACKYYMAPGHWQIYNWQTRSRKRREGAWETVDLATVSAETLDVACRATALIGTSLYGVDLKEVDGEARVIEINDNPNIDAGVEDRVAGDALYDRVVDALRTRIERRRAGS